MTSNYFCNFTADRKLVYKINHKISDLITTAEYNFAYVFPAMERLVSCFPHWTAGRRILMMEIGTPSISEDPCRHYCIQYS